MRRISHLFAAILCWTVLIDKPIKVIDGDTFEAAIPVWHRQVVTERIRVLDIDTPEMKGETKPRAQAAKSFTQEWLSRGPFTVETCTRDSFGRILGSVYRSRYMWDGSRWQPDGREVLADELRNAGHVK